MTLITRAGYGDRDGRLLRVARLLTEEGRLSERARLARRLEAHLGRIQDQRLDLVPEMPAAYLPAREAVRRAERALCDAATRPEPAKRTDAVVPVAAPRPRLFDRLRRRLVNDPGPVAASEADGASQAARQRAREAAERDLRDARRALARIEDSHARDVAATEPERATRSAGLARRTALVDATLALLAGDDGWTALGILALMRAARQALHGPRFDQDPVAEIDPDEDADSSDAEAPGPRFR